MTKKHPPAVPVVPSHSPTAAVFVDNFSPNILFGSVLRARTVFIARDAIILTTNVPIRIPSVSLNRNVWSPSLTAVPLVGWGVDALQELYMLGTTRMIGDMTVRTPHTMITTGRLSTTNTWKCQSRRGVMSWPHSVRRQTSFIFFRSFFPCTTTQNLLEHSTVTHLPPL